MNEVESRRGNREQREKGNVGVDLSFTATLPPLLQSLEGQLPISGDKEADRLEDSSMRIWSSEERKGAQGCNPDAHRTPVVFDESEAVSVWLCVSVCVCSGRKRRCKTIFECSRHLQCTLQQILKERPRLRRGGTRHWRLRGEGKEEDTRAVGAC